MKADDYGCGHGHDDGDGYGDGAGYSDGWGNGNGNGWGNGNGNGWGTMLNATLLVAPDDVAGQVLLATWRCA